MSKEQFKGLLQSFLIKIDKTNLPLALNDYSTHLNHLFEEKDQRIEEIEEQLKNAIVPKFKKGQEVFYINSRNKISSGAIYNVRYDSVKGFDYYIPMLQIEDFRIKEESLFATKAEALAKLEELKGENK